MAIGSKSCEIVSFRHWSQGQRTFFLEDEEALELRGSFFVRPRLASWFAAMYWAEVPEPEPEAVLNEPEPEETNIPEDPTSFWRIAFTSMLEVDGSIRERKCGKRVWCMEG